MRGRKRNVGRLEQSESDQETGGTGGTGCKNREIIYNNSTRCHSCARQGHEMFPDEIIHVVELIFFRSIDPSIFDFTLLSEINWLI